MIKLSKTGQAGTVESSDIMITIEPANVGAGLSVNLTSPVMEKFGKQIKSVIVAVCHEKQIQDAVIHAIDRGALDFTIRARTEAALNRAIGEGSK